MEFHKVWQEQREATRTIRDRFGVKSALDYLVGEKLLNLASEAERSLEFAAELPRFQAAVWDIFNPVWSSCPLPHARTSLQAQANDKSGPVDPLLGPDCKHPYI